MSKEFNLKTGKFGEEIAKKFLESHGYKVLEQNYRTKFAEADLICQKQGEKILVEVRTKKGELFGSPEESLTKRKLAKLWWTAKAIRASRIDAVCIVLDSENKLKRLDHYESIC